MSLISRLPLRGVAFFQSFHVAARCLLREPTFFTSVKMCFMVFHTQLKVGLVILIMCLVSDCNQINCP
ncbi:hypothetical protein Lalb_Chr06g0174261 [Lupinus albus]|uniref:Uncharacterized protein n=1 Tax=Lupinus albus TaxID=3870 RepID=A0A6A4QER1_LUPAL|nr:hypothetical protein Lalb_Chr06g0174261 [Lupinus albus]